MLSDSFQALHGKSKALLAAAVAGAGICAGCSDGVITFHSEPGFTGPAEGYAAAVPVYTAPSAAYGQQPVSPAPALTYQTTGEQLPQEQVNDLTSSIALYPDPLLAVMLPAATYSDEIVAANQWLRQHPGADDFAIDQQPYPLSVKSLMHYPTVLQLMAEHPDWTQALGLAFVYQGPDVMNSIQYWRAMAQADGTLYTTAQQQVVVAGPSIEILPVAPDVVYVPVYDPAVVYVRHDHRDPYFVKFQVAGRDRQWLDHDLDWKDHVVRVPDRRPIVQRPGGVVVTPDRAARPQPEVQPPMDRRVFTRNDMPRDRQFPQRVVMPTPDHKVIVMQPRYAQGRGGEDQRRAEQGQPGRDMGRGEASGRDK